jgi:hypothetical protein
MRTWYYLPKIVLVLFNVACPGLILMLAILCGCNNPANIPVQAKRQDTVSKVKEMQDRIIHAFNQDERSAMDSVFKYNLDSIHQLCMRYLYVLYSNEVLTDKMLSKKLTIGECNIRLTGFEKTSNGLGLMIYGVFINDSIPADVIIKTSSGEMINSFEVDLNKKLIICGVEAGVLKIDIKNIQSLYNNALKSVIFNKYIREYKKELHPKFLHLLSKPGAASTT